MTTLSSLSIPLILLSNLTNVTAASEYQERRNTAVLRLSSNCTPQLVRLDQYDRVELTSYTWPLRDNVIEANITCTAHFMTGNHEQGICVSNNDLFFKRPTPGIQLRIYTSKFGPDKAFNYFHSQFKDWCTEQSLISFELTSTKEFRDTNGEYRFSFLMANVTKEDIEKKFHMDSFKQCNLSHELKSGESIKIFGQRYPAPTALPSSCLLTLNTDSDEEYEELCIEIQEHQLSKNCKSNLEVSGFNTRFWPESEVLGCNDTDSQLRSKKEMCSKAKTLTLNLTRTSPTDTGMSFTAVVKVKWHPYWELISNEYAELRGLSFVKGLTYFIAAIDSIVGITAAVLATMFRHPKSWWRSCAESVTAGNGQKCEAVHYEGGFEVTYPEVSCSQTEEIAEAKAY